MPSRHANGEEIRVRLCIFNAIRWQDQSISRRLISGSGCHIDVWCGPVCLCFNPDLNDSLSDQLIKATPGSLSSANQRLVTCPRVNIYCMQSLRLRQKLSADTLSGSERPDNCQSRGRLSQWQIGQDGASQSHVCITQCVTVTHHVSRVMKLWRRLQVACDNVSSVNQTLSSLHQSLSRCDVVTRGTHQ